MRIYSEYIECGILFANMRNFGRKREDTGKCTIFLDVRAGIFRYGDLWKM